MKKSRKRQVGRPAKSHLNETMQLRLTTEDRNAWEAKATASGMSLSQYIRFAVMTAAGGKAAVISVEFATAYGDA